MQKLRILIYVCSILFGFLTKAKIVRENVSQNCNPLYGYLNKRLYIWSHVLTSGWRENFCKIKSNFHNSTTWIQSKYFTVCKHIQEKCLAYCTKESTNISHTLLQFECKYFVFLILKVRMGDDINIRIGVMMRWQRAICSSRPNSGQFYQIRK